LLVAVNNLLFAVAVADCSIMFTVTVAVVLSLLSLLLLLLLNNLLDCCSPDCCCWSVAVAVNDL
jgi:hypothetical protein